MVSILPGKLAAELKLAHLFIPEFGCFSYRTPLISPFPSPSELWVLPPLKFMAAAWSICLGGWGWKRRKGEWSQLFPAAVANQSKLPAQTAHSILGATLKPYLWVQCYYDTSYHGVWREKLFCSLQRRCQMILTLLSGLSFKERKHNPNQESFLLCWHLS